MKKRKTHPLFLIRSANQAGKTEWSWDAFRDFCEKRMREKKGKK